MRSIVFIPDGNRRFAQRKRLFKFYGHSQGAETARSMIETALAMGIEHVVFLGATELNLKDRDPSEVAHLYMLFKKYLRELLATKTFDRKIYIRGNWKEYHPDQELADLIASVELKPTMQGCVQHLTFLFGHDGRRDVADASRSLVKRGKEITVQSLCSELPTAHVGEVDCIFRSGVEGDPHNSGYLMPLQTGNSQFVFTSKLWPEVTPNDLRAAIVEARRRPRRLGK